MKLNKLPFLILTFLLIISCSGGGGGSSSSATTLSSIAVTPENPSVIGVATQQFTATGTYSDNSTKDITTSVTWSSSNTTVATIGASTGLATSAAAGTTTIKATSGSVSGSTTLTVTAPTLNSIDVSPATQSINLGGMQQFTATGSYADSTTKNITASVTWSSDNTAVATISNVTGSKGLAASLAAGTANITASLSSITSNTAQLTVSSTAMDNVIPITVKGTLYASGTKKYFNKPCVSVTVCSPNHTSTSDCVTVDDILLDTGSYGLRIFGSLLTGMSLPQVTSSSGGNLTSCIKYVDGSAQWGPVKLADVILGNETASNFPIQIIDSTFGDASTCGKPETDPDAAGFNGILGVGLFTVDCGSGCVSDPSNGMYYSCSGSTCTATAVVLSKQVANPISVLATDNNGFIVRLPSIAAGGVTSADGVLILGIETRSNNTVAGITAKIQTDDTSGEFTTIFNSKSYGSSFLDTGSNALYFDSTAITQCTGDYSGWYCRNSSTPLSAALAGYTASFNIGNAENLFTSSYKVFSELGGLWSKSISGSGSDYFDWGLPFYLGRNVYFLIKGNTVSSLGTGPYLAF